jgi:hypothetical protein
MTEERKFAILFGPNPLDCITMSGRYSNSLSRRMGKKIRFLLNRSSYLRVLHAFNHYLLGNDDVSIS